MKYEYSAGAILYRIVNNEIKYIIVKDRNNNYSFPKGHLEVNETNKEAAIREVYEEVGINISINDDFMYSMEYLMKNGVTKCVSLFLCDINNQIPKIIDGEILEILELDYKEAYNLITYEDYKKALIEANKKLQ